MSTAHLLYRGTFSAQKKNSERGRLDKFICLGRKMAGPHVACASTECARQEVACCTLLNHFTWAESLQRIFRPTSAADRK
jgi:hypothetical protein